MSGSLNSVDQLYTNILAIQPPSADAQSWATLVDENLLTLPQVSTNFVTSLQAQISVAPIIRLYEAELGRTPGQGGLLNWEGNGASISQIAHNIAAYGPVGSDTINPANLLTVYTRITGEGPNIAGEAYWMAQGAAGATMSDVAAYLAQRPDVALRWSPTVNTFLTTVGNDPADADSAAYGVALNFGVTLTTSAEAPTIASNETVTGVVDGTPASTDSTLTAGDVLAGVASGNNTLVVTAIGAAVGDMTNGALITNFATVDIRDTGAGASLDASVITGLTAVNSYLSPGLVDVTNLATGASVGVIGDGTVVNGAVTYAYATPTDAQTINLTGGTKVGTTITNSGVSGATSATINSMGSAANTIGVIDLIGSGPPSITSLTVNAAANLTATLALDFAPTATLTVSGAATKVDLTSGGAPFETINASGLTAGGLKIDGGASLTSFTGGAGGGNVLDLSAGAIGNSTTTTLDGGSTSNNTLGLDDATLVAADYTGINATTNFQTLAFNGTSAIVDQTEVTNSAITALQFATIGDVLVNNATAENDSIVGASNSLVTLNAASGVNVLNASLDGTSAAASVVSTGISVTDAQTLNLTSNGSFTSDNNAGTVTLIDNSTLNLGGSQALTLTVADPNPTAGLTINTTTDNFTGKLTLTTGTENENITTGTGGSDLTLDAGIDQVTLGTGADKLAFINGASEIGAGAGTTDTVTGFSATNDTFGTGPVTAVDIFSHAGSGVLLTDLNAAASSLFTTDHAAVVSLTGGADAGTYLVTGVTGAAASTDFAVKLSGLAGPLTTHDFV